MKNLLFNMLRLRDRKVLSTHVTWAPDLKVWRNWLPSAVSWIRLVTGGVSRSKVLQAATFAKFAVRLARANGTRGLVLYLKTAQVMLMQNLPGSKLRANCREIGGVAVSRSADGLPRVIPRFARDLIRRGDIPTLRLWLTFFGTYRIIRCIGSPSIQTIVEAGVVFPIGFTSEWKRFIWYYFLPGVSYFTGWKMRGLAASKVLSRPCPRAILTSSADSTAKVIKNSEGVTVKTVYDSSFASRFNSARRWVEGEWGWLLYQFLREMPGGVGTTKSLWTLLQETAEIRHGDGCADYSPRGSPFAGRLAFLEEPAGKVRVVALLDYWSQIALKPLHDWLFECLREIPQDGTFNQLAPVKELLRQISSDTVVYSYDLKAATDRLPVCLQSAILQMVFGARFAAAWKRLLVDRHYHIPNYVRKWGRIKETDIRYKVGQPMGGYSSWAMLAITHHAMVQFAAYRAGESVWFTLYAVLGDDIVIAHDGVAREYLRLCRQIGVKVGIAKSLASQAKTLEFAKRFFRNGEDASGMPVAFWAAAQHTMGVAHALSAWTPAGGLGNFVRALGVGFKGASGATSSFASMPMRLRALVVTLTHPLVGSRFSFTNWVEWLWSSGPGRPAFEGRLETLVQFTPFASAMLDEVTGPVRRIFDKLQEDLFFTDKVSDPCSRLVDAESNRQLVQAEKSLESAEKALRHLQRLNIKFQLTQVSAVMSQVTRAAEKAALIAAPSSRAMVKQNPEPRLTKASETYRIWSKMRGRAALPRLGK